MVESVNIHAAKTHLSRLVERVEAGEEIVIARAGRPVARLVPYPVRAQRIPGPWQGQVVIAPDFDDINQAITDDFEGSAQVSEATAPYLAGAAARRVEPAGDPWLPAIVGRIVHLVDPLRIILFGSRAWGDTRADSDYDILVIVDQLTDRRETRISIRRSLEDLGAPVDIVVAAPSEVAAERRGPRGIVQWAAEQGRVVYERL